MQQAFNAGFEFDEDAKINHLADFAFHQLALLIILRDRFPWIGFERFDAQRDAFALAVDVQHLHLDALPALVNLTGILDASPRKLGDMHQSV